MKRFFRPILRSSSRLWIAEDVIEVAKRYNLIQDIEKYAYDLPLRVRGYPLVEPRIVMGLRKCPLYSYISELAEVASRAGADLYLVGGAVRDLLREGKIHREPDLLLEGNMDAFINMACDYGFSLKESTPFLTIKLAKEGHLFDVALCRKEFYERPGALPKVYPATLHEDLWRRDFTINAMALCLSRKIEGLLYDPFYGKDDIRSGVLRTIRPYSFIEDATRIIRGIRLKVRFSLSLEEKTLELMKDAISKGALLWIGWVRLWKELIELFREENAIDGIILLKDLGGLRSIGIDLAQLDMEILDRLRMENLSQKERIETLTFLLFGLKGDRKPTEWGVRFQLPKDLRNNLAIAPLWINLKEIGFENRYKAFMKASESLIRFWSICLGEDLVPMWQAYRKARPLLSKEEIEKIAFYKGKKYGSIKMEILKLQLEEGINSKEEILEKLRKERV